MILLALLLLAVFWGYQKVEGYADKRLNVPQDVIFKLPAGSGRVVLEALLVHDHLIAKGPWFSWLLKIKPELANFKAGTYRFTPGMTVRQMLELLASGKEAQFSIRFVEGSNLQEWRVILQQAPYVKQLLAAKSDSELAQAVGIKDQQQPEGWFYPDTYHYTADTTDESLLKRAHQRMQKAVDAAWEKRDSDLPYQDPAQLLTMASIIEKETAIADERGKVASVFINRLRIGMRLQTDPTVIYGMGSQYNGTLTRKDLTQPTAYNTYTINGLPPGPIAMPSEASLLAAAHPAKTPYLYFVADGKGGHTFTSDLNSHNQAVRVYRQALKDKNGQ